jgi:hypothetical protein
VCVIGIYPPTSTSENFVENILFFQCILEPPGNGVRVQVTTGRRDRLRAPTGSRATKGRPFRCEATIPAERVM